MERIIVMGGSYNPPTIAHMKLMETALESMKAERGIFVPVGHAYLKRKLRKNKGREACLEDDLRIQMLRVMCEDDPRLTVNTYEIETQNFHTNLTMDAIAGEYPNAELCLVLGADKISLVHGWAAKSDFLSRYRVLLFERDEANAKSEKSESLPELIRKDAFLSKYANRIMCLPQPSGIAGISSTAVRKSFLAGNTDEIVKYLNPAVYEMICKLDVNSYPEEIAYFDGKYEFLSPAYPATFQWHGIMWPNAETAFQAASCRDESRMEEFVGLSAQKARNRAAKIGLKEGWDSMQVTAMEEIQHAKFEQNPELLQKLKATGNAVLVYGGKANTFWGKNLYMDKGENHLGQILMKIREQMG